MQALENCQISKWLPSFGNLAYRTEIIELPPVWGIFLTADGVFVDDASKAVRPHAFYTEILQQSSKLRKVQAKSWP